MNKELWLKRIRNVAGLLGMLLPWIALIGAFLVDVVQGLPDCFWSELSISETYYVTPALSVILGAASIVLMCYDGYELKDNIVTTISGVFGILIVAFPCNGAITSSSDLVGYFQIPANISNIIHSVSAAAFFALLSYNSLFLFTLGESGTRNKAIRNMIYRICGIGMVASCAILAVPVNFPAKVFTVETFALTFFGVSWLVKGGFMGILED